MITSSPRTLRGGLAVNRYVLLLAMLTASAPAFAFQNIEADALYNSAIKDQIRKEFIIGLTMLKVQADGLGVAPRDKDVSTLQQHMYDKAYLMGSCVDKAITLKKMTSDKILLDENVKDCIDMHMKFIAWLQLPNAKKVADLIDHFPSYDLRTYAQCHATQLVFPNSDNPPYDFLVIDGQKSGYYIGGGPGYTLQLHDYVSTRECYRDIWTDRYRQKHDIVPPAYLFDKLTSGVTNQTTQSDQRRQPSVQSNVNITGATNKGDALDLIASSNECKKFESVDDEIFGPFMRWLVGYRDGMTALANLDKRLGNLPRDPYLLGALVLSACHAKPDQSIGEVARGVFEMLINRQSDPRLQNQKAAPSQPLKPAPNNLAAKDLLSDIYFQMLRRAPGFPGGWFDDAPHRSTQPAKQITQHEGPTTNQVKAAEALAPPVDENSEWPPEIPEAMKSVMENIQRQVRKDANGPLGQKATEECRKLLGITIPVKSVGGGEDVFRAYGSKKAIDFGLCVTDKMYPIH
jgi:hypothetical protein